jgi:hypothetical protein
MDYSSGSINYGHQTTFQIKDSRGSHAVIKEIISTELAYFSQDPLLQYIIAVKYALNLLVVYLTTLSLPNTIKRWIAA